MSSLHTSEVTLSAVNIKIITRWGSKAGIRVLVEISKINEMGL